MIVMQIGFILSILFQPFSPKNEDYNLGRFLALHSLNCHIILTSYTKYRCYIIAEFKQALQFIRNSRTFPSKYGRICVRQIVLPSKGYLDIASWPLQRAALHPHLHVNQVSPVRQAKTISPSV